MSKVHGLQHFADYFKDIGDEYVIIGGVAADITLQENDISFRVTKDVDIVILTNSSDKLNARILEYVKEGQYQSKETIHGKQYFRFSKPLDTKFPKIIEIFAR
jgi:predicted nucleotidyltransferase